MTVLRRRHPTTVNLREERVIDPLNRWIGALFTPPHLEQTVRLLGAVSDEPRPDLGTTRTRLEEVEATIVRLQTAITAGVDPGALVDPLNVAHAERLRLRARLDAASTAGGVTDRDVIEMTGRLGDIGEALRKAQGFDLEELYRGLDLELTFDPAEQVLRVGVRPRVVSARVRGGT